MGQTKKAKLIEETQKIIKQYTTKLTVRQIYYRLVSKHIIPNIMSQYQYLVKTLVSARWDGKVSFTAITDRGRRFVGGDDRLDTPEGHFESWLDAFKTCDEHHKLPMWLNQENYVEVWVEKLALEELFQEVTDKWNVTLFACRGYPSLTKLYEAASRLKYRTEGRKIRILYFGDYDPSGEDIPRKIQEDLLRFGIDFEIDKIAILREQIEKYNIPPMPAKKDDPRFERFVEEHGNEAVELDAIDPKDLQGIIEEAISEHFDEDVRAEVEKRQEEERDQIKDMVKKVLKDTDEEEDEEKDE